MHGHMVDDAVVHLVRLATESCQTHYQGKCGPWRTPFAQYGADRMCEPCAARGVVDHVLATRLPLMVAHNAGLVG